MTTYILDDNLSIFRNPVIPDSTEMQKFLDPKIIEMVKNISLLAVFCFRGKFHPGGLYNGAAVSPARCRGQSGPQVDHTFEEELGQFCGFSNNQGCMNSGVGLPLISKLVNSLVSQFYSTDQSDSKFNQSKLQLSLA